MRQKQMLILALWHGARPLSVGARHTLQAWNHDSDTPRARQATACGTECSVLWETMKAATLTGPSLP